MNRNQTPEPLLPLGTKVIVSAEGVWGQGSQATIAKAYRIRFGHPMYDLTSRWGTTMNYYAPEQLTVVDDQPHLQPGACYVCGGDQASHEGNLQHTYWPNEQAAADFAREPQGPTNVEASYVQQHRPA